METSEQYLLSADGLGQVADHHHALLQGLICGEHHTRFVRSWPLHVRS